MNEVKTIKPVINHVFVQNVHGNPLMPTTQAKARHLLKAEKARVVSKCPYTIKLRFPCKNEVQSVVAACIPSSSVIGIAAKCGEVCLFSSATEPRTNVSGKMEKRSNYRRTRRNRKTRYRQARFNNRIRNWLHNPTINSNLQSHLREIKRVQSILPIASWYTVKYATAEEWNGKPDEKWLNIQSKVFKRDGYKCRCCKAGRTELHAHHIIPRSQNGPDTLTNLVTLCKKCHVDLHKGVSIKIGNVVHKTAKQDTVCAIIRKYLDFKNVPVQNIYGFQVKAQRIKLNLPHSALNNASAALNVQPANCFTLKNVAGGDYQQNKGRRSEIKIPTGKLHGFRKFDKVLYKGKIAFVMSKRTKGAFRLMDVHGKELDFRPGPRVKNLLRVTARSTTLIVNNANNCHSTNDFPKKIKTQ